MVETYLVMIKGLGTPRDSQLKDWGGQRPMAGHAPPFFLTNLAPCACQDPSSTIRLRFSAALDEREAAAGLSFVALALQAERWNHPAQMEVSGTERTSNFNRKS